MRDDASTPEMAEIRIYLFWWKDYVFHVFVPDCATCTCHNTGLLKMLNGKGTKCCMNPASGCGGEILIK